MSYLPCEPQQQMLLPEAPQDWLPEGQPAYFISDTVDGLDLSALHDLLPTPLQAVRVNLEQSQRMDQERPGVQAIQQCEASIASPRPGSSFAWL